jgi:hypothetical protein
MKQANVDQAVKEEIEQLEKSLLEGLGALRKTNDETVGEAEILAKTARASRPQIKAAEAVKVAIVDHPLTGKFAALRDKV